MNEFFDNDFSDGRVPPDLRDVAAADGVGTPAQQCPATDPEMDYRCERPYGHDGSHGAIMEWTWDDDDAEPVNAVGATEAEWNAWRDATAAWVAANPVPKHAPHEMCDCPVPAGPRRRPPLSGHCAAAVEGTIVPWKEDTR